VAFGKVDGNDPVGRFMRRPTLVLCCLLVLGSISCARDPFAPSGTDISGTWVGSTSDANGARQFRLNLTPIGSEVTGMLTIAKPGAILSLLGTVSGSMSRSTFTFRWTVPGSCSAFSPQSCDLVANGTASVSGQSITGSYSCSANCTDLISSGTVSLTKQQ
jgi:hypothetical protein